ncbi:hypothetical protein QFZ40_001078 [Arthrobacter pascens]|uniref:hypothetical protein n=1 Tax=Arthrobacter pascens TaxID=1677 RepID=UPI0027811D0A|nr:hypothetical protein [Arthrobacter pascens]MDQ0633169.1 hypothetical protein [Arthrobacter pascens]
MNAYTTGDRVMALADYVAAIAGDTGTVTNIPGDTARPVYCVQFDRTGDTGILPGRLLEHIDPESISGR